MTAVPSGVDSRIFCKASFDQISELVRLLAEDAEFRTNFEEAPRRELSNRGIEVPGGAFPEPLQLPPANVVREALGELQDPIFVRRARSWRGPFAWLTVLGRG
jgi:hypothetical protein